MYVQSLIYRHFQLNKYSQQKKKGILKYEENYLLPLTYYSKYKVQNGVKELAIWTQWLGKPFNIKRYALDD